MNMFRRWLKLLPGGIFTTSNVFGPGYIASIIWRMLKSYTITFFFLLFNRPLVRAYNFFYVKFFVPVGEGAGAGFYILFNPIIRKFPRLAPLPKYVEIETTTICPRKCIMCEHTYWKDREERHLSLDEFKFILGQFLNCAGCILPAKAPPLPTLIILRCWNTPKARIYAFIWWIPLTIYPGCRGKTY